MLGSPGAERLARALGNLVGCARLLRQPKVTRFTFEQVSAALNRACDDIVAAIGEANGYVPDEGLVDCLNLLVNATGNYLQNPDATLESVAGNYDATYEEVLSWVLVACR